MVWGNYFILPRIWLLIKRSLHTEESLAVLHVIAVSSQSGPSSRWMGQQRSCQKTFLMKGNSWTFQLILNSQQAYESCVPEKSGGHVFCKCWLPLLGSLSDGHVLAHFPIRPGATEVCGDLQFNPFLQLNFSALRSTQLVVYRLHKLYQGLC